jgi:hypothetical protein
LAAKWSKDASWKHHPSRNRQKATVHGRLAV